MTGNPIWEVIRAYASQIAAATVLDDLSLRPQGFFLVTLHRAENVDVPERLAKFLQAFSALAERHRLPVVVSTHPRTRKRLAEGAYQPGAQAVRLMDPFGFFEFVRLQQSALCVLTDSGTVQEECALLGTPNVTLRDVTERPETLECGSNILSGCEPDHILRCVDAALERRGGWEAPAEYRKSDVSDTVVRIVLGYLRRPGGEL